MQTIRCIHYEAESVRLDDKHFVDCSFVNCTLEYGGGEVVLERVAIRGCRHFLSGYASQTAQYMRTVGLLDGTAGDWMVCPGTVN